MADHVKVMRSQLGRARGLGTAKAGAEHWWTQRILSVALAPLSLWFIVSILSLLGAGQPEVAAWVGHPLNAALLLALILATLNHAQLGLQVVYEDYARDGVIRAGMIVATKGAALLLALLASLAVAKLFITTH
jgi:succinate dehydrogenase / fumarate reductase membrane anchor subunit